MTEDEVLGVFEACGALLRGHFVLSSGRHADTYLNKSIVSQYPQATTRLCRVLAEKIRDTLGERPQYVISPAMGAIIFGFETARHFDRPFMFLERVRGEFTFRRGFHLPQGAEVVIVEDIVSTGLSSREAITAVRRAGAKPLALACLVDRSGGTAALDIPMMPLARLSIESWPADHLPPHLAALPAVKPGSRGLQ
ncbi:orotate phosphoribosyltransferase [Parvularcula bermudensis HTCC2503]|uniref:Orotate phosphoribosyltransferase n=1 Tax=Parvularcula bermudensis (strain ATCC BAA-594 / HTCC2503 / KCTC 12087) TaxID=314260 RepID=E0TBD3_PARBH|nr:orotate phosphoribosyltransferase [Parvularcula bermudensis]ADM09730.1 orotate phosphoribosyltransferase [Parvularcula bermudensis HTCC2503]